MKYIGKTPDEMCLYALDYHSILHFIAGIIIYIIGFSILDLFMDKLASILITTIGILVISLIWEFFENSKYAYLKPNGQQDVALNTITDTILMGLGGIAGFFLTWVPLLITIITLGALFLIYIISKIFTEKKSRAS